MNNKLLIISKQNTVTCVIKQFSIHKLKKDIVKLKLNKPSIKHKQKYNTIVIPKVDDRTYT